MRLFYMLAGITLIVVGSVACTTGPTPEPVTHEQLDSGEETARQAGEAAREVQEEEPRVIYATSRQVSREVDEQDDPPEDKPPTVEEAAGIHVDGQGRFLARDGEQLQPEDISQITDDPLEGRTLRVIVDPAADELEFGEVMPLFEAIADEGASAGVTYGEAPEAELLEEDEEAEDDEEPDEDDEEPDEDDEEPDEDDGQ